VYLRFLEGAVTPNGTVHNRMSVSGLWLDAPGTDDMWGRAIEGLGAAARRASSAADVLSVRPDSETSRDLLVDSLARLPRRIGKHWQWPERRLRYANATLCQALIVGYVPNVVYSCGAIVHDETLWIPHGVGDDRIRVASVTLASLFGAFHWLDAGPRAVV